MFGPVSYGHSPGNTQSVSRMGLVSIRKPADAVRTALFVFSALLISRTPAMAQDAQAAGGDQVATDLQEFVGSYGPRHVFIENGALHYQREGMPMAVAIEAAGVDSFVVVIPPGAQVQGPGGDHVIPAFVFRRDESGQVSSLSLVNPDGTVVGKAEKDAETRPRPQSQASGQSQ